MRVLILIAAATTAIGCDDDHRLCDDGHSGSPPAYCDSNERCCTVGFERGACFPKDEPCPIVCPSNPGNSSTCPIGSFCLPDYEASCWKANAGLCTDTCPPDSQCGNVCCHGGLRCEEHNCCVTVVDAGLLDANIDAGTNDAGTDDAGTADAVVADAGT